MTHTWWCVDCRKLTELNKHGYCARCGSDAVDIVSMQATLPSGFKKLVFYRKLKYGGRLRYILVQRKGDKLELGSGVALLPLTSMPKGRLVLET